jgi:hypothetical protein
MKISTRNIILIIILLPVGYIIGGWVGSSMPLLGLLFLLGLIGFVVWVLMGNKQGATASPEALRDALTMRAPEGKARIYVLRTGFVGGMQGMNITLSSGHGGQIRSNFFLMAEVDPGTYDVTAQMNRQSSKHAKVEQVTLAAGESVLLDLGMEVGMMQSTPYFTVERNMVTARNRIQQAKLVEWKTLPA